MLDTCQVGVKVANVSYAAEAPAVLVAEETPPQEYGLWQRVAAFGRATGCFGADTFVLQKNGILLPHFT